MTPQQKIEKENSELSKKYEMRILIAADQCISGVTSLVVALLACGAGFSWYDYLLFAAVLALSRGIVNFAMAFAVKSKLMDLEKYLSEGGHDFRA